MTHQAETAPNRRLPPYVEVAARTGAIIVGASYAIGFVIVTLHHSQFGVAEFSLLRARVFSAGALFLFLTIMPAVAAARIYSLFGLSGPDQSKDDLCHVFPKLRNLALGFGFYMVSLGLAGFCTFLFPRVENPKPCGVKFLLVTIAFSLCAFHPLRKYFDKVPLQCTVLSFLQPTLWFVVALLYFDRSLLNLSIWFYIVGILTALWFAALRRPEGWRREAIEYSLVGALALLLFFSTRLYGQIRPAYGGGNPVAVVLHLSGDTPLKKRSVSARLVEETDFGYYVLLTSGEGNAYFLRRDMVSAVQFQNEDVR